MNIYQQNILDHYKDPQNYGEIASPDLMRAEFNPLCGDKVVLYLKMKNDIIEDIKFTGEGCAISIASMSLLTEKVKGMNKGDVLKLEKEDIIDMLGVGISPGRLKCALLGLVGLKNSFDSILK